MRERLITYRGRTQNVRAWANELAVEHATLLYRLKNWPLERAMGEAFRPKHRRQLTLGDETHSLAEWSRRTGISESTIHQRLSRGWSLDEALTLEPNHRAGPEAEAEKEPLVSINVRVPPSLKRRVYAAAEKANVSVNVWAMRCLEGCAAAS